MTAGLDPTSNSVSYSVDTENPAEATSSLALLDIAGIPSAIVNCVDRHYSCNQLFSKMARIDSNTVTSLDTGDKVELPQLSRSTSSNANAHLTNKYLSTASTTYEIKTESYGKDCKAIVLKEITTSGREESLYREISELRSSREDLEQLAFAACHDLRSPLRAMATIPSWISNDIQQTFGYLPPNISEHTTWLKRQALRLNTMLDDLLVYATIESSLVESVALSINLREFASNLWQELSGTENYDLSLDIECEDVTLPDKELSIILKHLLRNATTHHDKDIGRVALKTYHSEGYFNLIVRDDGPGIEDMYHEKALELFSTLKSRDRAEGSGMGLPITMKIVKSMKGRLSIQTGIDGIGTGIAIKFPYVNMDTS